MKTENTLDNKAAFFAQYWGQELLLIEGSIKLRVVKSSYFNPNLYDIVQLRPLSSITDDEAIEVSYILNPAKPENQIDLHSYYGLKKMHVGIIKRLLLDGDHYRKNMWHLLEAAQYLQSKGFALPWRDLSVDDMCAYGWIKLTEAHI